MLLQQQELAQNPAKIKRVTKWVAVGRFGLSICPSSANRVINSIILDFGPGFQIIFLFALSAPVGCPIGPCGSLGPPWADSKPFFQLVADIVRCTLRMAEETGRQRAGLWTWLWGLAGSRTYEGNAEARSRDP